MASCFIAWLGVRALNWTHDWNYSEGRKYIDGNLNKFCIVTLIRITFILVETKAKVIRCKPWRMGRRRKSRRCGWIAITSSWHVVDRNWMQVIGVCLMGKKRRQPEFGAFISASLQCDTIVEVSSGLYFFR